jgi:3-oxoacyl-[acyl-carrier protein] reductase
MKRRLAIVTGVGRQKGLGASICRALAQDGIDLFITYWSPYDRGHFSKAEAGEPIAIRDELRAMGVRCEALEMDLSQSDAPARLMDEVIRRMGVPSILVNNACHSERDGVDGLTAGLLDRHYAVNLRATALLSVEFARRFSGKGGGRIIQLTSGQSLGPMPGELAYAATKGAVEALTKTLAVELAPRGITVNAVNPGPTDTGWMTDEIKRELLPRFPMGRLGQPEDAARLIRFLVSPEAEWITGQVIHSEGGFMR